MPTLIRPVHARRLPAATRASNFTTRWPNLPRPTIPDKPLDGVLEGGAALGAAYIGSLVLLEQQHLWFRRIAGNSAGAITASMIAAGYRGRDIEWLCSAFPNPPARPPSVPATLMPIDFLDFLDFPTLNSVGVPARQKTLLWRALKGEVIDRMLATTIPIPTQANVVDASVTALKAVPVIGLLITGPVEASVRAALNTTLAFLPNTQPRLRDFQLFNTEPLRIAFADAVWSAVGSLNPLLVMDTQFWFEGSLFEGKVFLDTMKRLLGAKVHDNPNADVLFHQLPIPLAVIGANIETGRMEVYSSGATPNMVVADAVRRSMSLPLIFEPLGNTVVDGGLCSNFPAWLFTPAGDAHWPAASIDRQRPIVGLSLNETLTAPAAWGVGAGKFPLVGNPPRVDLMNVLVDNLIAKMKDSGLFVPSVQLPEATLGNQLRDLKALKVAAGSALMDKESIVRALIARALFPNQRYFDVEIPLLGFHGFDFDINGDASDLASIAERGWFAARDALAANPTSGSPLLNNPGALQSPF